MGTLVEAVLLVYRVGSVSRGLLKRVTLQMSQGQNTLMGVVLNGMKPEVSPDFHGFKYYKYYYSYGEKRSSQKKKWMKTAPFRFFEKLKARFAPGTQRVGPTKAEKLSNASRRFPWVSQWWIILVALAFLILGILWQNDLFPATKHTHEKKDGFSRNTTPGRIKMPIPQTPLTIPPWFGNKYRRL